MKKIIPLLLIALTGCTQTPLAEQDPLYRPGISTRYAEDRVTLHFNAGQRQLTGQQMATVERFANYYGKAKNTSILISLVVEPDEEDLGTLPSHTPQTQTLLEDIKAQLVQKNIRPRFIREVNNFVPSQKVHARAQKAIIDTSATDPTAENDPVLTALAPNPQDLVRETVIALVAREYTAEADACAKTGHWDWDTARPRGHNILLGCSVNKNLIAQVQDKSVFGIGKPMDDSYDSAAQVLALRKVQTGQFKYDSDVKTGAKFSSGGGGGR